MKRRIVAGVAIIAAAALTTSLFVFVFLVTPLASNRYIMHGPISIRGNDQFNGANGVTEGNGTSANPYVIQDWEINVNWADRISISDTDAHFVIRDVFLYNVGRRPEDQLYDGINLRNVTNGRVENAVLTNNFGPVSISSSANITVVNNNISANVFSVFVHSSRDVYVYGNVISSNNYGIFLSSSENVTVEGNSASSNILSGIFLRSSTDVIIEANSLSGNGRGVHAEFSDNMTIRQNVISGHSDFGIRLESVSDSSILNNNLSDNVNGIFLESSVNTSVSGNRVSLEAVGIRLRFSVGITVSGNHVSSNNAYGIYLVDSSGTLVLGNNLVDNTRQALEIRGNENSWDGGYPVGGNYWSDYTGQDNCSGPDQDMCPDPDGVGDSPYYIDANRLDRYPLFEPNL